MTQYQKQISYHIKLGVFLFVGILLMLLAVFMVGQMRKLFTPTFTISSVFSDVDGLQVGNNVRFGGLHIGNVQSVEMINDSSIRVFMIIENTSMPFIAEDATTTIGSDGLMGNKILIITPGTPHSARIVDGAQLKSIMPPRMDELVHKLSATIENVTLITGDLAVITSSISRGKGTVGRLLIDTVFAENLSKTIVHLEKGSKGLEETIEAAKHSILLRGYFNKKEKK